MTKQVQSNGKMTMNKAKAKVRQPPKVQGRVRSQRMRQLSGKARATLKNTNLSKVQALTKVVTLPHETAPIRFPNLNSIKKTAVLHLTDSGTIVQDPSYDEKMCGFVCRSPVAPVWIEKPVEIYFTQTVWVPPSATAGSSSALPEIASDHISGATGVPIGVYRNQDWIYVPSNTLVKYACAGFTATGLVEITVERMQVMGEIEFYKQGLTVTAGVGSVTAVAAAYSSWVRPIDVDLDAVVGIASGATVILEISGAALGSPPAMMPLFPMLEQVNAVSFASATRVNSSSLLLTNTTAALTKSGTVIAAQLDGSTVAVYSPTAIINNTQSRNYALKYSGPLSKGLYTYTVPDQTSSVFDDYVTHFARRGPTFHLEDAMNVNAFYLMPNAGSPQSFQFVYDVHLEFITSSQMYNLGVSTVPIDDYQLMLTAAGSLVPFTENPTHWAALARLASLAVRHLAPYMAPYAMRAVDYAAGRAKQYLGSL